MISAGEWITATGEWTTDRNHGLQFKARFLKTTEPSSVEGIEKYLASGMIRGIGAVYAKRLVRSFGKDVFDIIETSPEKLRQVAGIGPKRAGKIIRAWADQKVIREIMVFLHSHGVGAARAVRIFKTYGADAVQVMSENPYRLARDIRGIGFKTADLIAEKLGIEKTAMVRIRAGISYALTEAMGQGHCGLPVEDLQALSARLLEVEPSLIQSALELELAEGTIIADTAQAAACIFLAGLYYAEKGIAERMRTLFTGPLPWLPIDPALALPWIEKRTGLALAPSQADAITLALRSKVTVITGGPGVGKTTIVNAIPRQPAWKPRPSIACLSSTPRALASNAAPTIRSNATSSLSMRPRWWT
jgi:exodeoxyribonuclease V alpha subunit